MRRCMWEIQTYMFAKIEILILTFIIKIISGQIVIISPTMWRSSLSCFNTKTPLTRRKKIRHLISLHNWISYTNNTIKRPTGIIISKQWSLPEISRFLMGPWVFLSGSLKCEHATSRGSSPSSGKPVVTSGFIRLCQLAENLLCSSASPNQVYVAVWWYVSTSADEGNRSLANFIILWRPVAICNHLWIMYFTSIMQLSWFYNIKCIPFD